MLVGERLVDLSNCPPLSSLSSSLSSVDAVVNVITILESCHMCMGNDDTKFGDLDRSVFKDRTGTFSILACVFKVLKFTLQVWL